MSNKKQLSTGMTRAIVDFETWKMLADRACINRCGMSLDDLPDWDFRTAYEDGMSAKDAATRAITNARNF